MTSLGHNELINRYHLPMVPCTTIFAASLKRDNKQKSLFDTRRCQGRSDCAGAFVNAGSRWGDSGGDEGEPGYWQWTGPYFDAVWGRRGKNLRASCWASILILSWSVPTSASDRLTTMRDRTRIPHFTSLSWGIKSKTNGIDDVITVAIPISGHCLCSSDTN